MLLFNVQFRQTDQKISVQFQDNDKAFGATFKDFQKVTEQADVEIYTGSYDVTPQVDAQSLATKDKFMTDDVRIHEIPFFDVGNTSGGSTVYIGTLEELIGTTAILGTAKLGSMTI